MNKELLSEVLQAIHNALVSIDERLQDIEIPSNRGYISIGNELSEIRGAIDKLTKQKDL